MVAGLILAFCLMFILASGALVTTWLGIRELRKLGQSAFIHMKAVNVQEAVKATNDLNKAEVDLEQLKDAWTKEMADTEKIPQPKKRVVKDMTGRQFDMDDLEAL